MSEGDNKPRIEEMEYLKIRDSLKREFPVAKFTVNKATFKRTKKKKLSNLTLVAYATINNVDELNSYIGLCTNYAKDEDKDTVLGIAKEALGDKITGTIVKEKKIGRNEPCPCGSGKKYKHCCLNKA